jgi:hypothetical protein
MKTRIADYADLDRANHWARRVYAALEDWDVARKGRWSTGDGGDLLLEVEVSPTGMPCERVSILAADERIGFLTRTFELRLPMPSQTFERAIEDMKGIARQWFAGEVVIASFWGEGKWRGSTMIDARKQEQELGAAFQWVRARGSVDRLEIQTPFSENDKILAVAVDGVLQGGSGAAS